MQSIKEKLQKSKPVAWLSLKMHQYGSIAYFSTFAVLIGISAFLIGRLVTIYENREPVSMLFEVENPSNSQNTTSVKASDSSNNSSVPVKSVEMYVASKTGKAYYFPWCATAKRIKEENKIWFTSRAAAEKAGYQPAANCPGLK